LKRRSVVVFLVLMGVFVSVTTAYNINNIENQVGATTLVKYQGDDRFLTTYESRPLGKNKVLVIITISNELGAPATATVTVEPYNRSELPIAIGSTPAFLYKVGSGDWTLAPFNDPQYMIATVTVSLAPSEFKTIYYILDKDNLALEHYMSVVTTQELS